MPEIVIVWGTNSGSKQWELEHEADFSKALMDGTHFTDAAVIAVPGPSSHLLGNSAPIAP